MITIIIGPDRNTIQYRLIQKINPISITECEIIKSWETETELVDKINQSNLFGKQSIVIQDCDFLDENPDIFLNKIQNSEKQIYLTLVSKKIFSTKLADIIQIKSFGKIEKEKLVDQLLNKLGATFKSFSTKQKFLDYVYNDPFFIENEIFKLSNYSPDKEIDDEVVSNCLFQYEDENIFKLINFFLSNKKHDCIELFENLISKKYQPVEILQIISTQIFNVWLYQKAISKHLSSPDIEKQLRMSKFQQITNFNLCKTNKNIFCLINDIYILDYNIKHGNANPYLALKTFLLK